MEFEEAFGIVDTALFDKQAIHLNDVQRVILLGTWERQEYHKIAENYGYAPDYLKNDVGAKLWKLLSEVLGEKVNKKNFSTVLGRQAQKIGSLPLQDEETIRNKPTVTNPIESNTTAKSSVEANSFLEYFSKSIDQLKNKELDVRIGAISTLGTLAKYSQPAEHWTIMEYLAAFVRTNAPRKEEGEEERSLKLPEDIQAALTVIGRRDSKKDPENQRLDLSNIDIRGAILIGANLQRAILSKANLQGTDLRDAKLQGADLTKANLQRAKLWRAELEKAKLQGANLEQAVLNGAELQGARLDHANLRYAYLWYVNLQQARLDNTNLEGAILNEAELQGARLDGANLKGAFFNRADLEGVSLEVAYLEGADLSEARNLKSGQIEKAFGDSTTVLPNDVARPERWL